jgi:hypothetical protein
MTLLRGRDRARVWNRARPGSWMWPDRRRNIDHTGHSSKAVQSAEVRVSASLRKRVLVNEPCVRKNSSVTVRVIRRTELPISCARRAAGDTVVIAAPGPPHRVADRDVECVRHKPYCVSRRPHRHIENLAASQSSTASHLTAVLIDNPDDWNSALFSCRASVAVVVGFSCGQECHPKQHYQPTTPQCSSL